MKIKYFAYGSNMDPKRMKERGVSFSKRVHAVLKGYSLRFNKIASGRKGEGYANIVPDEVGMVEGVLYEIDHTDLEKLDKYEGCPYHYHQIKVKVELDDGEEVEAIAYVANPERTCEGLKPSKEYMSHLLVAKDLLSPSYYKKLKSIETVENFF